MGRYKYPRTRHLPWSPGCTADDIVYVGLESFEGQAVVVTEKMDGENSSLYRDHIHARSLDGRPHPSRDWLKGLHGRIAHLIPEGWRLCGENLYARHSLEYRDLPSYFMLFSIWNESNRCLSWSDTQEWAELLGVAVVPTLHEGVFDEEILRGLRVDTDRVEGYVVRLAAGFAYDEFGSSVAKWVRSGHVQTNQHWMHGEVIPNGLRKPPEAGS